jgi:hypothetical protein
VNIFVKASADGPVSDFCPILVDHHLVYLIAGLYQVYKLQSVCHTAKAGVVSVQVAGVLAAVADEELATAGVSASMCHA